MAASMLAAVTWSNTSEQWKLARDVFALKNDDFNVSERLNPNALSMHYVGPHKGHSFCQVIFNGWLITYVQVYKSNSIGVCANVWALSRSPGGTFSNSGHSDAQSAAKLVPPHKWLTFTVVREPLGHFESAFTEIEFRARRRERLRPRIGCCQSWPGERKAKAQASAFIIDYLAGHIFNSRCCKRQLLLDMHAVPQVAFLTFARTFIPGRVFHRILRLESLNSGWLDMGRDIPMWPPFNDTEWHVPWKKGGFHSAPHPATNVHIESDRRKSMHTLLANKTIRLAICRVLLPDYTCLHYTLPDGCEPLHDEQELDCSTLWSTRHSPIHSIHISVTSTAAVADTNMSAARPQLWK